MLDRVGALHKKMFFHEAIANAVREAMTDDPTIFVMGQDVGAFGGSYREFDGLHREFGGDRVRDTPVAENATIGIGAGAAAAGFRPLVSITYMDFLMLGFDPLINYAAKLRYKTAGALRASMVVKSTAGAHGQGVAHSQCLDAWLMSVPGLSVVVPSNPQDAYSLMVQALRHDGPVVYIDHKRLFPTPGEVALGTTSLPFGQAVVRRPGNDVTITCHSYMVGVVLQAAAQLQERSVSCEVIDLRTLAPLDMDTIERSVHQTGRLVTVEEGQATCGVGAEVLARLFSSVGPVPFARVGALPAPVSSNPVYEALCIPDSNRVCDAVSAVMGQ
jgi:acetoin:2,6-dichlorophenolindophenol oxidoreductase subunit beta